MCNGLQCVGRHKLVHVEQNIEGIPYTNRQTLTRTFGSSVIARITYTLWGGIFYSTLSMIMAIATLTFCQDNLFISLLNFVQDIVYTCAISSSEIFITFTFIACTVWISTSTIGSTWVTVTANDYIAMIGSKLQCIVHLISSRVQSSPP